MYVPLHVARTRVHPHRGMAQYLSATSDRSCIHKSAPRGGGVNAVLRFDTITNLVKSYHIVTLCSQIMDKIYPFRKSLLKLAVPTISRHGIDETSFSLLVWLNEIVR